MELSPHQHLIPVTTDHIQRGQRTDATTCPVALAINEKLDGPIASVGWGSIIIRDEDADADEFCNTNDLKAWVQNYDGGEVAVKPFNLLLDRSNHSASKIPATPKGGN